MLAILVGSLAFAQQKRSLMLTYQGHGSYNGCGITSKDIPEIRENMEFLIRNGYLPILIEGDWDVIWIYLNDLENPIDAIDIDFESDYLDEIQDLFCIKTDEEIKTLLKEKWDNKKVLKLLGIRYKIDKDSDEVISKIKLKKFAKYL